MYIVQINFNYRNMTPALHAANDTPERAKMFLGLQGLQWKIWLNTEGGPKVGGIYCFDTRANAQAYLDGPIVAMMKASPEIVDLTAQIFGITEQPSRVTRAPVSFPDRGA